MATGATSGKWQATALPEASVRNRGSTAAQRSVAFQQRVLNRQPDGGSIGDGTSPTSRIRLSESRRDGLATGTADIKALVYGWAGLLYKVAASPTSTIFPKYITAT